MTTTTLRRQNCARAAACLAAVLWLPVTAGANSELRRDAVVRAVEKVMPCVVNISTETMVQRNDLLSDPFSRFFGYRTRPRTYKTYSVGSGVVINEAGYVLTNFHVVERASRIRVTFADGREYDAERLSYASGWTDIALLRVVAEEGETFPAIEMAENDDLLLGETVLALGNPFGLGGSVSRGILSSKTRRSPNEDEPLGVEDWLQTDAAINPGNSGGPLVNLDGRMIGVNVAVYRAQQAEGIGFAIPVQRVRDAVGQIFSPETTHSLWFGARVSAGSSPLEVAEVYPNSPAGRAGLRAGDRILRVNGEEPVDFVEFNDLVGGDGDRRVEIGYRRDDRETSVTVEMVNLEEMLRTRLGASVQEVTPELARYFGVGPNDGLLIADVEESGPLAGAGLEKGDLIGAINGVRVNNLANAALLLSRSPKDGPARLGVVVRRQAGPYVRVRQAEIEVDPR